MRLGEVKGYQDTLLQLFIIIYIHNNNISNIYVQGVESCNGWNVGTECFMCIEVTMNHRKDAVLHTFEYIILLYMGMNNNFLL